MAVDVQPKPLDLNLYAGDVFAMQFLFTDSVTSTPVVLEGTWRAQIRLTPNDATVITEFTVDATQQAAGKVFISLTGEQTALLAAARAYWDLQQTTTAGVRTWYRGSIGAAMDVTRP